MRNILYLNIYIQDKYLKFTISMQTGCDKLF